MRTTILLFLITVTSSVQTSLALDNGHFDLNEREKGRLATQLMNCGYFDEYLDLEQQHYGVNDYERGKSEAVRHSQEMTGEHCRTIQTRYQRLRSPAQQ